MKNTFKGIVVAVIGTAVFYTACKKVSNAPVPPKIASEQEVAGIVATDFAASLATKYGGVALKDGVKLPSVLSLKNNGTVVNSTNPLCGYRVDTTVTYTVHSGNTSSIVKGSFDFTFTCSAGSAYPDGYIVTTDLLSAGKTPTYSYIDTIGQHYVVQSLVPQDTLVSLNGTLKSFSGFKFKQAAFVDSTYKPKPVFQNQSYLLTGLTIDIPANLDVISGTATFNSNGSNSFGTWTYTGTIVFLPNHKAIITINGKQYNANLLTGTVTPI